MVKNMNNIIVIGDLNYNLNIFLNTFLKEKSNLFTQGYFNYQAITTVPLPPNLSSNQLLVVASLVIMFIVDGTPLNILL